MRIRTIKFFWCYISAASACFVTFIIKCFWQNRDQATNQYDLNPSQFVLMAMLFAVVGYLLATIWQAQGIDVGKMRPLFAHGSTRSIWIQLPLYELCLGTFIWWPLFSLIRNLFYEYHPAIISMGIAILCLCISFGWKGIVNLPQTTLALTTMWQINFAFFGTCLLAAGGQLLLFRPWRHF